MALWKPLMGNRTALDTVEKHAGYVYFCTDDGTLHFDFVDSDGTLQRKQISAKDAETLMGASLETILNSSDAEIPTSKAVLDALENISWNDLNDKPFGEVEGRDYVVEETQIVLGEDMGWTETSVPTTRPFDGFVDGQTYYVVFDGEVYPVEYDPDLDVLNVEAVNIEVYYGGNDEVTVCIASSDPRKGETHTFGLYTTAFVFATLDEQYIPDTIARVSDVNEQIATAAVTNQSDWSINDETSAAYVKNRPFYESDPIITVLVEEQSVYFTNSWSNVYTAQLVADFEFNKNDTYQIIWDDLEYNLHIIEEEGSLTLGDPAIFSGTSTDGQPPFLMVIGVGSLTIGTLDTSESHVISIACHQTDITTLPSKFLSEDVFTLNNFLNVNYTAGKTVQNEYGTGEIFNDYERNVASGEYSHAEGVSTTASNTGSHAEGSNTTASGIYSHAEGRSTVASGGYGAHAEGTKTTAAGNYSHSEGWQTTANSESQHVQGEWNIIDTAGAKNVRGTYAHIVGNGTSDTARSNAHTLDWSGNGWFKGIVKIGGTGQDDAEAKELATQEYVVEQILAMLAARKPKIATVELAADAWVGEGNLYSQVVTIDGVTEYSQVDLTPSIEQLVVFYEKDLGFVTENEDGVVTVYAIGQRPENDYTIQVTITEVNV